MLDYVAWILLSWLGADFIAGLFHFVEDRYWDESTPIVGRLVGGPNKKHHSEPRAFLRGNYWQRNYTTIMPASVGVGLCLCLEPLRDYWLMFAFLTQANEVHCWAHQPGKVNWLVEALQETGLVQSARHHNGHHGAPYDIRFCVMSCWLNPWLDRGRFWIALEWLIWKIFRVKPQV